MCYPDSVLFHARLTGLTGEQRQALEEAPGLTCRPDGDDGCLVRVQFAHSVPSWPDVATLEAQLRTSLRLIAPDATIADVRYGYRYLRDPQSPAAQAVHRLRSKLSMVARTLPEMSRSDRGDALLCVMREFSRVDEWLSNGGSIPAEWARRHPGGDEQVSAQLDSTDPLLLAAAS